MPFIILIVVFELFSCLLVFWWILELSTFSGFLHLCVRLRGFFWCLDNLDSFFFMWNCSWYRLVHFITTFLLGKYVTFWHLLTFGATFWYLENFFFIKWMEKVDKNARKHGKVSGPGLYKRNLLVQERPSIQQVRYSTSCSLTCYCLDTWQAWANATKWGQEKLTFADVRNKQNTPKPNLRVWLILGSSPSNWAISYHRKCPILIKYTIHTTFREIRYQNM